MVVDTADIKLYVGVRRSKRRTQRAVRRDRHGAARPAYARCKGGGTRQLTWGPPDKQADLGLTFLFVIYTLKRHSKLFE